MKGRIICVSAVVALALHAQQFAPGYVDPKPVLAAAERAIGADRLNCVTVSGSGYTGMVGQQHESAWNVDWPRGEVTNYRRTMNWQAGVMREEFDRKPGVNPASWKYGLGWKGGGPIQANSRQTFVVNGKFAWHMDGERAAPVAAAPEDAERWQLDLWLNPPGFLKAAKLPGANPRVGPTLRPAQPQGHLAPGGQWKCPSGIGTETVTSPPAPTTVFVTVVPKTVMSNVPAK